MERCQPRGAALFLMLLFATPAAAVQWSLATPATGVAAQSVAAFSAAVAQGSRGALEFTVAPQPSASLPALASGKVVAAVLPLAELEAADPLFAMDRVPYLCTNFVDAAKLWQVLGPHVARHLETRGLVLLYAVTAAPDAPLSNRALTTLADWRGTRVLASRGALTDLSRILGAQAVSGMTVRDALLGRRADVAFQSAAEATAGSAWEYASHYLDSPAWFPKQLVVARRDAVDALDDATRAALVAASRDAEAGGWRLAQKATIDAVQKLRDYGMKTLEPPVGVLIQLEALGRELLFLWSDAAGETGAQLVEQYYAIR